MHFLKIKPTRCTSFSNLFWKWNSTCFGQFLWSCCSKAVYKPVWHIPLLSVEWITPDDGQRNCPKHVEFHFQNKYEKLVHLVGIIIRKFVTLHGHMTVKTNLMHYLSSVYFFNQPLHVSAIFVAHHQEVYCIYTTTGTCCAFQLTVCWLIWFLIKRIYQDARSTKHKISFLQYVHFPCLTRLNQLLVPKDTSLTVRALSLPYKAQSATCA
jgi:hypothetical protein